MTKRERTIDGLAYSRKARKEHKLGYNGMAVQHFNVCKVIRCKVDLGSDPGPTGVDPGPQAR